MKLYSTVTSERASRPAKKGGDEYITITLSKNNEQRYEIVFTGDDAEILEYATGIHYKLEELMDSFHTLIEDGET